jgi:hypothetical protein
MKKRLLKFLLYCVCFILFFYGSVWLFSQLNHSFPSYFTVYPEGFNEESFNEITVGDDKKIVESLIGKPLRESIDNVNPDSIKDVYWYTKAKSMGLSYDKIYILFYEEKVSNIKRMVVMD